jgi:hydrogenase nickel incorporation protein HypA/HybF
LVRVQIGTLRQVIVESLLFSWNIIRAHEGLPHAELQIETVAAAISCTACGARSQVRSAWSLSCPTCNSPSVDIVNGNEFVITSIDVALPAKDAANEPVPSPSRPS